MVDLVTGAAGFIGSHLACALARRGGRVRVTVHRTPLPPHVSAAGVESVAVDLARAELPAGVLDDVGRIFHCAALVSDWGAPADFTAANVTAVGNLLRAARKAGVRRLVHLSTTDVYGYPDRPVDEDAPLRKRGWPYGDTKIEGERLVWRAHAAGHLDATVIRPANVYGPGSLSFVDEIATLLRDRGMIHLGWRQRPAGLCHVDNLVAAVLAAADRPATSGRAYNVTDASGVTWREFTNALADATGTPRPGLILPRSVAYAAGWGLERTRRGRRAGKRPLLTRMAVELFTTHQDFCIARARRELGYEPSRQFAEALPEIVQWLEGRIS